MIELMRPIYSICIHVLFVLFSSCITDVRECKVVPRSCRHAMKTYGGVEV
jgi:hypothetical protein